MERKRLDRFHVHMFRCVSNATDSLNAPLHFQLATASSPEGLSLLLLYIARAPIPCVTTATLLSSQ